MARFKPPTDWNTNTPLTLGFLLYTTPLSIPSGSGLKSVSDVYIVLRWHRAERVADRLAGTVDNKAGYGSPEAAQTVARQCANLLRQGVDVTYDVSHWGTGSTAMTLRWQQFDGERYCDRDGGPTAVESDGDEGIASWEGRVAFYRWLEAQVKRRTEGNLRDPHYLVEALRRMGAVPLLMWEERRRQYGDDHVGWIATTYEDAFSRLPVKPMGAQDAA
jgi:hypothetical protein